MPEDWGGPYLQMAVLCEQVLQEKDGVLSLIRIVDRIIHTASGPGVPEKMPAVPVNLKLVVTFKSGIARGSHPVRVRPVSPSGGAMPELSWPILFEGEDRGHNLILNIGAQLDEEGLYWFEILLGERLVTRIPLRLVYQRVAFGR